MNIRKEVDEELKAIAGTLLTLEAIVNWQLDQIELDAYDESVMDGATNMAQLYDKLGALFQAYITKCMDATKVETVAVTHDAPKGLQ